VSTISFIVFEDGERYPMLMNEDGFPDFWMTLFVTAKLRPGHKASSIENTMRNILHLRLWEQIENRDLVAEFTNGQILSKDDVERIRDHCLLNTSDLKKELKITYSPNVASILAHYPTAKRKALRVSWTHYGNRLSHIASYLSFIGEIAIKTHKDARILRPELKKMDRLLRAQRDKVQRKSRGASNADFKAPSPEIFEKFLKVVAEDSPDNPYKSPLNRKRNALMFNVLDRTGIRSGELLGLHIGDIDFNQFKITVERRHDSKYDPRTRQPVQKTNGRTIRVHSELIQGIRDYIFHVRANIPGANKHPFIFVTHKKGEYQGRPISDSTFRNRILKPATKTYPDMYDEVRRHGFRHNFTYRISKRIDAHNAWVRANPKEAEKKGEKIFTERNVEQILMELNGWSSASSAEPYLLRYVKEKAEQFMIADQEEQAKRHWNRKTR
jgi:integrase